MGRATRTGFLLLSLSLLLQEIQTSPPASQINQEFGELLTSRILKHEQDQTHKVYCSRERSRAAWKIIDEYLMPFVEQEQYQIPSECRLHPDNDLFRDQEMHKAHVDINEWQCGYCKKRFRAEKFLDQHFDNRHSNLLNVSHGKCLADLCGALHCDFVMNSKLQKTKCNPAAAAKNLHLCESLADKCFPVNKGPSASRLHELFLRQFCDAHTCKGKLKPFSRGAGSIVLQLCPLHTYRFARRHPTIEAKKTSALYLVLSILTLTLLPIFYVFVYLFRRDMRSGVQDLKRISKVGSKTKAS